MSDDIDWAAVRERLARITSAEAPTADESQRILDERARALARHAPRLPDEVYHLASFSVGSLECLVELHYLRETTRPGSVARIPGSPPHLLGVFALRGVMLPLFELRALLGEPPPTTHDVRAEGGVVLVLGDDAEYVSEPQRPPLGLLVDRIDEPLRLPTDSVRAPPPSLARPYLRGITGDGRLLLDGMALLDEPRLRLRGD